MLAEYRYWWPYPCNFLRRGGGYPEGRAMKFKAILISVGLALVLVGAVVAPRRASAQDGEADRTKRKIRVKVTPIYPALARQMNVYGRVKVEADGRRGRARGSNPRGRRQPAAGDGRSRRDQEISVRTGPEGHRRNRRISIRSVGTPAQRVRGGNQL